LKSDVTLAEGFTPAYPSRRLFPRAGAGPGTQLGETAPLGADEARSAAPLGAENPATRRRKF
jgi:hypothetical protein